MGFTPEIHGLLTPTFLRMLGDDFRWDGGQREEADLLLCHFLVGRHESIVGSADTGEELNGLAS